MWREWWNRWGTEEGRSVATGLSNSNNNNIIIIIMIIIIIIIIVIIIIIITIIIIIIIIITIIIITIIIIINISAAGLRINYNVALNQMAFQYSTYGGGNCVASNAVDGDRVNSHSSTNGDSGQNEWWAVDLGRLTYVGNVTITPYLISGNPGYVGNQPSISLSQCLSLTLSLCPCISRLSHAHILICSLSLSLPLSFSVFLSLTLSLISIARTIYTSSCLLSH